MTDYTQVFGGATIPPSDYSYSTAAISSDTTLFWPYNYTGTGTVVSRILEVSSGAGLSLLMPAANQVSTGEDVLFRNVGANTFTVKDAGGNTIVSVDTGVAVFVYVTDNTTVNGAWASFTYGTGTSAANAASLAGAGLSANGALLQSNQPVVGYAASHTVAVSERGTFLNFTGGSATFTYPAAGTLTTGFWTGVVNNGTGALTIAATAPNTIDEASTKVLAPSESCIVATDGANLMTLGYGRSSTFVFTQLPVSLTGLTTYTVTSAQSANKLWYFYNAPAGNVTVTIPAVASVYYIKADSLGGYSLTFTTGSGSTYIVDQNQQAIIFCDGVNVVAAQTAPVSASSIQLGDGTVGSPALNWVTEPTTGMYRSGAGKIDFSVGGVRKVSITSTGIAGTDISNTPAGSISATTVQAAINELDGDKDATGGYAGLTLFKINFKNAANTFTSFFTNTNSGSRTYTFKDADGTVAFTSDITGTNSGTNTGDETVGRIGTLISGATSKTTPVDADTLGLSDSAASAVLKSLTWSNLKATLKAYFDTLYAAVGSGSGWITKTTTYNPAVNGDRIAADTSGGAFTITLPSTPTTGHYVEFTDGAGTWATNALTIGRNGSTIMGLSEDMTCSTNNDSFGLVYNGATWRMF
jgi:hypothetical protein